MKTIVLLAIIAFVSAQTDKGNKTEEGNKTEQSNKTEQGNKTETLLAKSPALQEIYDCKPGEKCADDIVKVTDKFSEAAEKACPKCSEKTKKHMALFVEAIKNGMSVKKAQRLHNPNNKYFDVVDNAQMAAL